MKQLQVERLNFTQGYMVKLCLPVGVRNYDSLERYALGLGEYSGEMSYAGYRFV